MSTTTTNTPTSAIRQSQILPDSGNAASAEVPPSQAGFSPNASQAPRFARPKAGARYKEPLDYAHPYDSMRRFARLPALRYDMGPESGIPITVTCGCLMITSSPIPQDLPGSTCATASCM